MGVDSLQAFWDATVAFGNHLSQVGFGMLAVGLGLHLANLLLRSLVRCSRPPKPPRACRRR